MNAQVAGVIRVSVPFMVHNPPGEPLGEGRRGLVETGVGVTERELGRQHNGWGFEVTLLDRGRPVA